MTRWRANSKLTLSLRVLSRRADGFHELDALVVSVTEPHDQLTVTAGQRRDRVELVLTGPAAQGVTPGGDNLVVRAARMMLDRARDAHRAYGVRIELDKHIPAEAGLGGGSADAAAALHALDRLLDLDLSTFELATLGADLGSDVPFCVHGGAASMRGRGETVERTDVPALHVVVAVPPFALATPRVFRAWDALGGPRSERVVTVDGVGDLVNDLEPAAEDVEPRLRGFREALEVATGAPTVLAGSGSACASLFQDAAAAAAAVARVAESGIARLTVAGSTASSGVERLDA
ncbi:MAG TPA: 4-(cytidine 5'-diphospho)-2-C-methyl-D-erythritol kinase [Acidimicrobiia bacterium]|nr:4-(cytidine 5'-diphospho)-2-C-methyl-D-erythritol kinase [Acidimicrobiia bacterium]